MLRQFRRLDRRVRLQLIVLAILEGWLLLAGAVALAQSPPYSAQVSQAVDGQRITTLEQRVSTLEAIHADVRLAQIETELGTIAWVDKAVFVAVTGQILLALTGTLRQGRR